MNDGIYDNSDASMVFTTIVIQQKGNKRQGRSASPPPPHLLLPSLWHVFLSFKTPPKLQQHNSATGFLPSLLPLSTSSPRRNSNSTTAQQGRNQYFVDSPTGLPPVSV